MYHYTECGLDNVWLTNGFTKKQTAYGEAVAIAHADALHKLLAEDLINN
jgi:putative transcriptional regulator